MSKTTTTAPAYMTLIAALLETCDELGLAPVRAETPSTLPENKGFVFLRFGHANAAALIVPKASAQVKLCDIHIDCSDLPGWVDLKRPNGRVMGHVDASQADWMSILMRLSGAEKRAIARSSGKASASESLDSLTATLKTLGTGKKPASQQEEPEVLHVTEAEEAAWDQLEEIAAS